MDVRAGVALDPWQQAADAKLPVDQIEPEQHDRDQSDREDAARRRAAARSAQLPVSARLVAAARMLPASAAAYQENRSAKAQACDARRRPWRQRRPPASRDPFRDSLSCRLPLIPGKSASAIPKSMLHERQGPCQVEEVFDFTELLRAVLKSVARRCRALRRQWFRRFRAAARSSSRCSDRAGTSTTHSSWPGIAVRRTACFRTPMTRPSMRPVTSMAVLICFAARHRGCAGQARA